MNNKFLQYILNCKAGVTNLIATLTHGPLRTEILNGPMPQYDRKGDSQTRPKWAESMQYQIYNCLGLEVGVLSELKEEPDGFSIEFAENIDAHTQRAYEKTFEKTDDLVKQHMGSIDATGLGTDVFLASLLVRLDGVLYSLEEEAAKHDPDEVPPEQAKADLLPQGLQDVVQMLGALAVQAEQPTDAPLNPAAAWPYAKGPTTGN